jgi:hypothetical protein
MARANPVARKLLAAVVAPLVKAHGGPPKVADVVGRHRSTVTRWVKGDIDWDGLTELASGLRRDIVVTFPAHGRASVTTKEPPPDWARALTNDLLLEIRLNRAVLKAALEGVDPARAERILTRLESQLGPPELRPGEDPAELDGATGAPQSEALRS